MDVQFAVRETPTLALLDRALALLFQLHGWFWEDVPREGRFKAMRSPEKPSFQVSRS